MKKIYFLTSFLTVVQFFSFSQLSCGDVFTDSGTEAGNYSNDEAITTTICPTAGQVVLVNFSEFLTEEGYDSLTVFDGNSTAAPMIGTYQGSVSPGNVYSTVAGGCLTFLFESDGSVTEAGWVASISCVAPITCLKPTNLQAANPTNNSITLSWTPGGNETQWLVEYGAPGFTLGSGTTITASSSTFNLTNLVDTSIYEVYVTSLCGAGDTSFATGPISFNTNTGPFICGNLFIDNGAYNNYQPNSNDTTTICPNGNFEFTAVTFIEFNTEAGYDSLMVFNGSTTNDVLIGTYQGANDSIGTLTSTNANGCLTFVFSSDNIISEAGWVAQINCVDANVSVLENEIEYVTIYPNPTTGVLTISNDLNKTFNLQVLDTKAAIVVKSSLNKLTQDLNLSHLDNGIYFLNFSNDTVNFTKQINIIK